MPQVDAPVAAAPDGGTLFISHDHTISILPQVVKAPGFDPERDFVAVAGFATFVNGLALSGGTPEFKATAKVLKELVGHHVDEEERNIWAQVKENFTDEQREQMNRDFLAAKKNVKV